MAGINKVIIVGRLGRDPEIRYTQDGTAVANFSVATSEEWQDKNSGEKRERTEWHRIVAWRRLGEICGEYLTKGRQVYIEGRLQTRSWEKDGQTHYMTEIVADKMQMLGSRTGDDMYAPARGQNQRQNQPQNQNGGYYNQGGGPDNSGPYPGGPGPMGDAPPDDDIPF